MYHWEADQEDYLVLSGEGRLIVEGEVRTVRQWDFVHFPAGTQHVIVSAGEAAAPCLRWALATTATRTATAARTRSTRGRSATVPGVEEETNDARIAYARYPAPEPVAYEEGWLP
jgi:uncharacterized cupin superfamily protein